MRTQAQLRHTRTRLRSRYALFPLEGYPVSNLPLWNGAEARILCSPAMGAKFVQYLIHLESGGGTKRAADLETETFFYVLNGSATLAVDDGGPQELTEGGFALVPHTHGFEIKAKGGCSLLALRKRFETVAELPLPEPVIGNQNDIPAEKWENIDGARLQELIPPDLPYDIAMNIFSFEPGYSLPVVETHVMEHGLYFLQGKGLYYLDDEWMEVEEGDFIWMGPFVPQSFYATGTVPARYLYYKNVNRDIMI